MDSIHHVAVTVQDIPRAISWYRARFDFDVTWQDDSWALLAFDNISLALVTPQQHPPHVAFVTNELDSFGDPVLHRDGTASVYITDSEGNTVEMLTVPDCA
jgi:catechol 2,3-dioxygenase-like lactoylglutathione lyase family enzyme